MPEHIPFYENQNKPVVEQNNKTTPRTFFNAVRLKKDRSFVHRLEGFESVCVVARGTVDITVGETLFESVGRRKELFEGKPDSVYVPVGRKTRIQCRTDSAEIFIAGGLYEKEMEPFRITPDDTVTVQYGSDETKTHRKIYHVLGQNARDRIGRLLVSELFTVGAGGWSGFPPHKHDEDRGDQETAHEEVYHFRFNPSHGFGAQFAYVKEDDFGPVYHLKNGSTILLDAGYHPAVAAPGYEMYYFTILVGKTRQSLIQHFHPDHAYQLKTIPGIMDMVKAFK